MRTIIKQAQVVNEGNIFTGDILIENGRIAQMGDSLDPKGAVKELVAEGLHCLPGVIDDQVHFREPGLTHKANIYSEARAAVAGGTTSFMEMPNTQPPTFDLGLLEEKYAIARAQSLANYSFFMGTSNDNLEEIKKANARKNEICGLKIFMGSSTGNLLVENPLVLEKVFGESELLIATHCEEEPLFKANLAALKKQKTQLTAADHPLIRNEEVCFESSFKAIQYAKRNNSRLHILHISTERELQLFTNMIPLKDKRITAEVCVHHLHFSDQDYARLGNQIKCNPAIKAAHHREALWAALNDDRLDIIATDHAPHTWAEKQEDYEHAHAGLPLVQHALQLMLHQVKAGRISLEKMVEKMSHAVADCYQIKDRGYLREGYFADLVLVDLQQSQTIEKQNIFYRCGWSPLEGFTVPATIAYTLVNGQVVYGKGEWNESVKGQRLLFDRD